MAFLSGFEIELLAPRGRSRDDLAARVAGGQPLLHGFKLLTLTFDDFGEPIGSCELIPAVFLPGLAFVDDFSIHADLEKLARPVAQAWRLVFDDARLGALCERRLRGESPDELLGQLLDLFGARLGHPEGDYQGLCTVDDSYGRLVAVVAPYGEERERVTEVVTRPLQHGERRAVLGSVLEAARELGFGAPAEGSVHIHYDADPWRSSQRLCRLILAWNESREGLLAELLPNPRTPQWRGAFPEAVISVARQGSELPFPTLCQQLARAGLRKPCDLNLLGVIRPVHRQPTLEVRVFPVDLDVDRLLQRAERIESFLDSL